MSNALSLVADIGGTNTRVALASGSNVLGETVTKYKNAEHASLEHVLTHFIKDQGNVDPLAACIAIAGPVRNGKSSMTNLNWEIDETTLSTATKAETSTILNDLQAQGHALGFLPSGSERTVFKGKSHESDSTRLMVGVGTGFNIAAVFETGTGRYVSASESGHISLPVATEIDAELSSYLAKIYGFASVEHALSGSGLENLYKFHCARSGHAASPKSASNIMAACNAKSDPIASQAVKHFVQILGTVCGDLALVQLPFSGIYLVGGVSRAIVPHLDKFGFQTAFREKGRFAEFMQSFSVLTIEDDFAALTGCAAYLEHANTT